MDGIDRLAREDELAHAYLVRGGRGTRERLMEALAARGISVRGNPDFFLVEYESLSVDDARAIADYALLAPLGERKHIVIVASSATTEAQTALLKTVEEGTGRSQFFFIVPVGAYILPTLASRCVSLAVASVIPSLEPAREFLALSYADRLVAVEKFSKDKDREGARQLVRSLLALADTHKLSALQLRDLLDADRYLSSSGSSVKAVLGHVALTL